MAADSQWQTAFEHRVNAAQHRLDAFREQIETLPAECKSLVTELLEELSTNLEELSVAMEELNEQNQELLAGQQALEAERGRYQELFDFAPDAYLVTDGKGMIREVNQAAETLFNNTRQDLLDKPLLALVDRKDYRVFVGLLTRLRTEDAIYDQKLRIRAGKARPSVPVAVTVAGTHHPSGAKGDLRWLLRDINEQQQAQERLKQLQAELVHAARLSALGGMAAGLAHELNQPLTAIVSYTQTAQQLLHSGTRRSEDLIEPLKQVAAQGLRAGEIIRRLREFARNKKGQRETVAINALIRELIAFVEWRAHKYQVRIYTDFTQGLLVMADSVQIQQVLLNLINNAIEALQDSPGKGEIVIRTVRAGDSQVEVTVADSGPGISEAEIERIFHPFFTTKPQGMGIGLDISRSIIEAHGGRLWVTSSPGAGATFHFTLPLAGSS